MVRIGIIFKEMLTEAWSSPQQYRMFPLTKTIELYYMRQIYVPKDFNVKVITTTTVIEEITGTIAHLIQARVTVSHIMHLDVQP